MVKSISVERIYDKRHDKGYRVLVDRLWPRGISKSDALFDEWCKVLSPTSELRQWFGHDPAKWEEFQKRYLKELRDKKEEAQELLKRASQKQKLILLYSAKTVEYNHALVLKNFLESVV